MMDFSIALEFEGEPPKMAPKVYDPVFDDPTSLLADICECLSETGRARFVIRGFGSPSWPVDMWTDLCVALEQTPFVIGAIDRQASCKLAFYEQGVERTLTFFPEDDVTKIDCVSCTSWQPDPSTIRVPTADLLRQLRELRDQFTRIAMKMDPSLDDHPWFRSWRDGTWYIQVE